MHHGKFIIEGFDIIILGKLKLKTNKYIIVNNF